MIKQDTGPESGLVYYNSTKVSRISSFDVLSYTLERAYRKNIAVYAWFPLLYDKRASEMGLGIGDYWVCPVQSIPYYTSLMEELNPYDIDGILYDYLRFPDDFAASEQLKKDFGQTYGYNMNTVELSIEKERSTTLWGQWISYRHDVLSQALGAVSPEHHPVGVTVIPEDIEKSGYSPFTQVDFVAAHVEDDPTMIINTLTLSTKAAAYTILPNNYVSQVRQLMSESTYADLLIFDSNVWDESAFKRIITAENQFNDVRMTIMPFIDFYNNEYDMNRWKSYEINTAVLPAGHVFSTYFKYLPYKEKWSAYTEKFDRDYVKEMIEEAKETGLYVVLELNIQSEEYVTRYKDTASITSQWGAIPNRVCLTKLNSEHYKTEFFEMAKYLAENYEAEALLVTNMGYLEDCFCSDCLDHYVDFMAEKGVTVEDWPRTDGEIDIYNETVREWKTAILSQILQELREYLRDSNKELWIEVPVSTNLEYASSEYGLHLTEIEAFTDRIVLANVDMKNPPRIEKIVKSLPDSSKYILSFPVDSESVPARAYLLDSLKIAYDNTITSTGVYPHSAMTDSLWGAFYIAYAYRLALTDEGLAEIYTMDDYGSVIDSYFLLKEEKEEEEKLNREKARQNIYEAEKSYEIMLESLEEARNVDLSTAAFEGDIQQNLTLLSDAKISFIEGNYQSAEEKGKTVIIEFSTLDSRVKKMVREERIERVTSGISIMVVFLLIMMYVRFKMRKRKK
jgi:hypothetical protein